MKEAIYEVTLKLRVSYHKVPGSTLTFDPKPASEIAAHMRDKAEDTMGYGGNLFWSLQDVDVVKAEMTQS